MPSGASRTTSLEAASSEESDGRKLAKQESLRGLATLLAELAPDKAAARLAFGELRDGVAAYGRAQAIENQRTREVEDLRAFANAARIAAETFPVHSPEILFGLSRATRELANQRLSDCEMTSARSVRLSSRHLRMMAELRQMAAAADHLAEATPLRQPDHHLNYLAYVVAKVLKVHLQKAPSLYAKSEYAKLVTATFAAAGVRITGVRRRMEEGRRLFDELEAE